MSEIAGRVMKVDHKNGIFTIKPYSYEYIQSLVTFQVNNTTKYFYNVVLIGANTPSLNVIHAGSWARSTYSNVNGINVVSQVIIHLKAPNVTLPRPEKNPDTEK